MPQSLLVNAQSEAQTQLSSWDAAGPASCQCLLGSLGPRGLCSVCLGAPSDYGLADMNTRTERIIDGGGQATAGAAPGSRISILPEGGVIDSMCIRLKRPKPSS